MTDPNFSVDDAKDSSPEGCTACGYALAAVGVFLGIAFLYMSCDVLSGGGLTRALGLGTNRGTEVEVS